VAVQGVGGGCLGEGGQEGRKGLMGGAAREDYNTAINVIGGLKDVSVLFKAIEAHFSDTDSLKDLIHVRNAFNLRTEKSRERIERGVRKGFLVFQNEDHQRLVESIFTERVPVQDKELALLWQFALNNKLFREITTQVFIKTYYSGRASIGKDDVAAYLKDFLKQNTDLSIAWTESTIHTISTKYLNLMNKLGLLGAGKMKAFKPIRPTSEAQVLFLYFAKLHSPNTGNILTNEFLPMSFISSEDVQNRYKRLSLKGHFDLNYNGVVLGIDLKYSYKGICDVLYH